MNAVPHETGPRGELQVAAVLLTDIVGFGRKNTADQQITAITRLNEICHRAIAALNRAMPPWVTSTGDGMYVVFTPASPEAPLLTALEIAKELKQDTLAPQVRMGMHLGAVKPSIGIDGSIGWTGEALNTASRITGLGDAGHILLSRSIAYVLSQDDRWSAAIRPLPKATVKHDLVIDVFNFVSGPIGNPDTPKNLLSVMSAMSALCAEMTVLCAIRNGPRVPFFRISEALISAFADTNRVVGDISRTINRAEQLRRLADESATVVDMTNLPIPGQASPKDFWTAAFQEACLHGPRMLAALILAQPPEPFQPHERKARELLIKQLIDGCL